MALGNAFKWTHLTGAGTTTILSGIGATQGGAGAPANVGLYGGVTVNTAGTTVTVYDSATGSGTVLAVIGAVTGSFEPPTPGAQLTTGLTVVIAGAADVTVYWQ
ncbi:MAG TPA: hypothetical protein VF764_12215 [Steroidobacteraceae bacterium]